MVVRVSVWCKGIGWDVVENIGFGARRKGMQSSSMLSHGAKWEM